MYKSEVIKINVSSSFISRARCKKCASPPIFYFYSRNPILWYDPNRNRNLFDFIIKNCKRLSIDYYKLDSFVHSTKLGLYNHSVNYKGYRPKLHMTKGVNPIFDFVENLACSCGQTVWSFAEKSVKSRPEIVNRKSKYKHSNSFIF